MKPSEATIGARVYFARSTPGHEGWIGIKGQITEAEEQELDPIYGGSKRWMIYLTVDSKPPKHSWSADKIFCTDIAHIELLPKWMDTCICDIYRGDCKYHCD